MVVTPLLYIRTLLLFRNTPHWVTVSVISVGYMTVYYCSSEKHDIDLSVTPLLYNRTLLLFRNIPHWVTVGKIFWRLHVCTLLLIRNTLRWVTDSNISAGYMTVQFCWSETHNIVLLVMIFMNSDMHCFKGPFLLVTFLLIRWPDKVALINTFWQHSVGHINSPSFFLI